MVKKVYHFKIDWINVFVQLVLWGLVFFIFLLIMMGLGHNVWDALLRLRFVVPPIFNLVGIFFVNYLFLIPRYLLPKRYWVYAVGNFVGLVAVQILSSVMGYFIYQTVPEEYVFPNFSAIPVEFHQAFHLVYLLLVFLLVLAAVFLRVQQLNRQLVLQEKIRTQEQAQSELERLKGQLNPHFLFNTLNNISSLSAFDPDATQNSISKLSEMLRYVLYDSSAATVPLQKDLDFLQNYIDLMNIRYEDTLKLDAHLRTAHPERQVPPMLYISLLENAYKYGASSLHACFITVTLEETENELCFSVRNSMLSEEELSSKNKGGIGFENLEKRLQLLFPEKHQLTYGEKEPGIYETKLTLNIA